MRQTFIIWTSLERLAKSRTLFNCLPDGAACTNFGFTKVRTAFFRTVPKGEKLCVTTMSNTFGGLSIAR